MGDLSREELIFMAKLCENTERYEDMLVYMKKVANLDQELSSDDRNLLSVAYKNTIGPRRVAWRAISSIESKEETKSSNHLHLLQDYKKKIEKELNVYCEDILQVLDQKLIPSTSEDSHETRVFYLKMKGDYYRYMAEHTAEADGKKQVVDNALEGYTKATEVAESQLKTTNPIRLGLALNFSVFYYEALEDPTKACEVAKTAFDQAISDIEELEEDVYKDATTIMQLIRDNLTLWTSELEEEDDDN